MKERKVGGETSATSDTEGEEQESGSAVVETQS